MTLQANLTLKALLKDPIYKKWFQRPPKLKVLGHTKPWQVILVKKDGKMAKIEFETYVQAYNFVVKNYKDYADLIINSKRQAYNPPVVKFKGKKQYWCPPRGYRWCSFCRRPTRFGYFSAHPAFPNLEILGYEKRCVFCGAKADFVGLFETNVPPSSLGDTLRVAR